MQPYPLRFAPILKEKVWGGRRLERFGKHLPPGANIGESWEVADLASTSPDGGGGDEARSLITNGSLAGRTLHEAMREIPGLMGDARPAPGGAFPLLVKFLDACENLSVQVHPSPAYVAAHPGAGAHLKTESWYILDAAPGAVIYKGIKESVDRARFERDLRESLEFEWPSGPSYFPVAPEEAPGLVPTPPPAVIENLIAVPAHVGDIHHLPSGTCHALGAGVLVAEVQIPSDTTFRVYDWGRTGRSLHVQEALQCIDFGPCPPTEPRRESAQTRLLVRTEFYTLRERTLAAGDSLLIAPARSPRIWMVLKGAARIESAQREFEPVEAPLGATVLLPASAGAARLVTSSGTTVLEAWIV